MRSPKVSEYAYHLLGRHQRIGRHAAATPGLHCIAVFNEAGWLPARWRHRIATPPSSGQKKTFG